MDHLPEASTASRELIHCGCKKGCTGYCKCKKAAFKCTALCQCRGEHKISLLNMNFKGGRKHFFFVVLEGKKS